MTINLFKTEIYFEVVIFIITAMQAARSKNKASTHFVAGNFKTFVYLLLPHYVGIR